MSEIARRFGINTLTLFTILKKKEQIRSAVLKEGHPIIQKHLRPKEHPQLETALFSWFCQQRATGIPITGPMMKAKAEYLCERLGEDNFKCSDGWFARFKNRKGLSLHKLSGESSSVDVNAEAGLRSLKTTVES